MYKSIFHERINIALARRNMKQIELAEKTGLSRGQISGYLSGVCKPKNDKLYLISVVLNVNPMWLMGFNVPISDEDSPLRTKIIDKINNLESEELEKVLQMLEILLNK